MAAGTVPAFGGQTTWSPGSVPPALVLALGDGAVKKTLDLPSGALQLDLTLRLFLADSADLVLTWKTDGQPWVRQAKKMPGETSTDRVTLPPGRLITLEIATAGGTPLASIKLRRN
jgi:hypothetical protein